MEPTPTHPKVSIILPTYNRAKFLPEAFESITGQTFKDWELIIVDDGSTDNTGEIINELTSKISQPHQYIYQENQGAYGARNTGLDHAKGDFIAFYDSDDLWLPHHLSDCVTALDKNPDVDWVYGSCRIIEFESGTEISPSTFYVNGKKRPFLNLPAEQRESLIVPHGPHVIETMISHGLYNGLQNSVIRREFFSGYRFDYLNRNEAEDQVVVIKFLKSNRRIGFFDNVHVDYRVHDSNSSTAGTEVSLERQERVLTKMVEGFEALFNVQDWSSRERIALRKRLLRECFWTLGYATYLMNGMRNDALRMFRRGLTHWPWDLKCWKTFFLTKVRSMLN